MHQLNKWILDEILIHKTFLMVKINQICQSIRKYSLSFSTVRICSFAPFFIFVNWIFLEKTRHFEELIVHEFLRQTVYSLGWKIWPADIVRWLCGRVSCVAAGDVLRGDDDAAGRIRDADGLPAEQLQGAAGAVHGSGVLLLHRHRGGPHTRYVSGTPDSPPKCVGGWVAAVIRCSSLYSLLLQRLTRQVRDLSVTPRIKNPMLMLIT